MVSLAHDGLSELGTVRQAFVQQGLVSGDRLDDDAFSLLEGATRNGSGQADFYSARDLMNHARQPNIRLLTLLVCERLSLREGNACLDIDDDAMAQRLQEMGLPKDFGMSRREIEALPDTEPELFLRERDFRTRTVPLILCETGLYRQTHWLAEQRIALIIRQMMSQSWVHPPGLHKLLTQITVDQPLRTAGGMPIELAPEQKLAALVAVISPFTVISGGPGTGKTSTLVTILRLLAASGVSLEQISLAAPTGRAANRMGEAISRGLNSIAPGERNPVFADWQPAPKTLHRLLDWSPTRRTFRHDVENPLTADYLLVDEASMIDLSLMEHLMTALRPGTHLILLGDADQLPSVDAGAIFSDLSRRSETPQPIQSIRSALEQRRVMAPGTLTRHVVHLERSFRQGNDDGGQHIQKIARKTNACHADLLFGEDANEHIRIVPAGAMPNWQGVELLNPAFCNIAELVSLSYQQFLTVQRELAPRLFGATDEGRDKEILEQLFQSMERLRFLCLTHHSLSGVEMVNRLFRERFPGRGPHFFPGLPWMVQNNDYRLGLFNGDIGLGLWFARPGSKQRRKMLVFREGNGFRTVPFDKVSSGLTPAFAMTVHKSQGSEMDHVVLTLPDKQGALLKKEIIYTALTRARKSVLIYGTPEILMEAVAETMTRTSGLRQYIADTSSQVAV